VLQPPKESKKLGIFYTIGISWLFIFLGQAPLYAYRYSLTVGSILDNLLFHVSSIVAWTSIPFILVVTILILTNFKQTRTDLVVSTMVTLIISAFMFAMMYTVKNHPNNSRSEVNKPNLVLTRQ
jgi:hypothetical protein